MLQRTVTRKHVYVCLFWMKPLANGVSGVPIWSTVLASGLSLLPVVNL